MAFFNTQKSKVTYWITIAIAAYFIFSLALENGGGLTKLMQAETFVGSFAGMGLPFFTVYLAGFAEGLCPFLMLWRPVAGYAAFFLLINFAVILYLQATVLDGSFTSPGIYFILSAVVFWWMRPDWLRKQRSVTTIKI
jgi:hypothetical protein